jgi:hypothetical protein
MAERAASSFRRTPESMVLFGDWQDQNGFRLAPE